MNERKWRMLELYPEYKNDQVLEILNKIRARFSIEMKGFIKAFITLEETVLFEQMAYVHNDYKERIIL